MNRREKTRRWIPADIGRMKMLYPIRENTVLAKLFGRSVLAIKQQARRLGLKKDRGGEYVAPYPWPEKLWTADEVRKLRRYYPTHTIAEITEILNRSTESIRAKAKKLRLKKANKWTDAEFAFLERHYTEKGSLYVAEQLGRTPMSVRHKAFLGGLQAQCPQIEWTEQDDRLLKQIYFKLPIEQVAKQLGHSVSSVKHRAWKLRLLKQVRWTDEEVAQLRQLYPTHSYHQIAEIIGRPFEAVKTKGKYLGLSRAK